MQVGDENGAQLFSNEFSEAVENRIKNAIESGITINGRLYEFLAFSSSQLKECSLWMVCLENRLTVSKMRDELGSFANCRTASKYAARIGQCFSTTVLGAPFRSGNLASGGPRHTIVDDVVALTSGKVHSDGTGLISRSLMRTLLEGIPFAPKDLGEVSIIQIRYGGAKGTLSAWDLDDVRKYCSLPRGFEVFLRPSMTKFDATYTAIEVCSIGASIPYYLNRNVILLLGVHRVPDFIFLKMQQQMLDDFDDMLCGHEAAVRILPSLSGPDSTIRSVLLHMLQSGLSPSSEPFLFSCLHAIRSHHLFSLRKKARILVKDGAVLMGGLDETGLVPEGCVFLQVTDRSIDPNSTDKPVRKVITGAVMVTKHPVMHPGDARMLLAVDILPLRSQTNVILFSKHGDRPEADKMSGSDLDGDEFAVTWDTRLFLKEWNGCSENWRLAASSERLQQANHAPMAYDAPSASSVPTLPTAADALNKALIQHFLNHQKSDNLGQIAMLWQDYAALYGADCDQCIRLAELHSIAVDFPKSGVPAVVPDELRRFPRSRAHWREKKGEKFPRHCSSIIGKLYDDVTRRNNGIDYSKNQAIAGRGIDKYGLILTNLYREWRRDKSNDVYDPAVPARLGFDVEDEEGEVLLEEAQENRSLFEEEVLAVMKKYKIRSEGELFTGCIRKFHKLHKRRQHDLSEDVRRRCRAIRSDHRFLFFSTVLTLVQDNNSHEDTSTFEAVVTADYNGDDVDSDYGDEEGSQRSETENQASEEQLAHAELVATRNELDATSLSPYDRMVRTMAFRLAAAYYINTYSLSFRDDHAAALFSFPWIVEDVILAGLNEEARARNTLADHPGEKLPHQFSNHSSRIDS